MSPAAIAIGASAGGVEALSVLLPALTKDFAAPVLVVLHLPKERPSLVVSLFVGRCALPVREAEDQLPLVGGSVTFAPPDYHLLVDRGPRDSRAAFGTGPRVALSIDGPVRFSRPSIDVLFESAADVFGPRLLAVVLTGASDDGAAGLAAVARAGGTCVVQDPKTAYAGAMPAAALARVPAAAVMPLAEIAALFASLKSGEPR